MNNKSTDKLLKMLNKVKNQSELKKHIDRSDLKEEAYQLCEYILEVCKDKDCGKSKIIRNSDIHRTYGYQILNGNRLPSRDKLLQICVGNKFSLEETNKALTIANLGILYAKELRDSIIIYSLNNKLNLLEANIILDEHGLKPLGDI